MFIAEVDEISEAEDDAEDFFAEETSYADKELVESAADKRAEKAKSFFEGLDEAVAEEPVAEAVEEEPVIEEIAEDSVVEVIEEEPVIENAAEEPVIEFVEDEPVVVEVAEEPVQIVEEEKPRRPFGRRKEETEPEVIKPMSLADMRKNKEE